MSKDSTFEVVIEQRMFNKGDQVVKRTEYYDNWQEADAAWCAYRDLIGIRNSGIISADMIEQRRTIVHKHARKEAEGTSYNVPGLQDLDDEITLIDEIAVPS